MATIAWPAGFRRTKPRELVWRILSEAEKPLEVRELCARLLEKDKSMAVSTVYRVLAAFEECGMVTKTTMMGEDSALYSLKQSEHAHEHYAICLGCHKQVPLKHCPFENLTAEVDPDGFMVTNHRIELYGYCKECQEKYKK